MSQTTNPSVAPDIDVLAVMDEVSESIAKYLSDATWRQHDDARTAVAALIAERDARDACIQMIYAELQHLAPWSASNDMETVDEIMCALGLLAQDRDALAAENKALLEAIEGLKFDCYELILPEFREAFGGEKTIWVVQIAPMKALRKVLARTPAAVKGNDDDKLA